MPRKLEQIETEALKLGVRSRAHFARKLLESLDPPPKRTTSAPGTTRPSDASESFGRREDRYDSGSRGASAPQVARSRRSAAPARSDRLPSAGGPEDVLEAFRFYESRDVALSSPSSSGSIAAALNRLSTYPESAQSRRGAVRGSDDWLDFRTAFSSSWKKRRLHDPRGDARESGSQTLERKALRCRPTPPPRPAPPPRPRPPRDPRPPLQPAHRRGLRRLDQALHLLSRQAPPRRDGRDRDQRLRHPPRRRKAPSARPPRPRR